MSNSTVSSSNGSITMTKTGLIHTASAGAYSGRHAEMGTECNIVDAPKRGRGRPTKASQPGFNYDFSILGDVKIPKWTGSSRVILKKDYE